MSTSITSGSGVEVFLFSSTMTFSVEFDWDSVGFKNVFTTLFICAVQLAMIASFISVKKKKIIDKTNHLGEE